MNFFLFQAQDASLVEALVSQCSADVNGGSPSPIIHAISTNNIDVIRVSLLSLLSFLCQGFVSPAEPQFL